MAKLNTRIVALTAALAALAAAPVAAQSATTPEPTKVAATVSCTATKWNGCSFEQRIASVSSFCDTSGVPLKDADKAVLGKASRKEFLATLGCVEEAPADVADTLVVAPPPRVRPPRAYGGPRHRNLDRDLAARALEVLGPAPTANHSFRGVKRRAEPAPRDCTRTARRVSGGTYYRVVCD